ncbi:MAG TPA: hypothetical protein VIM07_10405 [Chitinophagaceae bacterium]|jgi:hypothetical protein
MLDLKEKYILNKQQKQVAVQLDIKTFKRIEEVLEDYALAQYMKASKNDEKLNIDEAKSFYKKLAKK